MAATAAIAAVLDLADAKQSLSEPQLSARTVSGKSIHIASTIGASANHRCLMASARFLSPDSFELPGSKETQ